MKAFVRSVLALTLAFSISCSRGGADDAPAGNNAGNNQGNNNQAPGGNQGTAGALGAWEGNDFEVEITNGSMLFIRKCGTTTAQGPIRISLTPTDITIEENKTIGSGNCQTQFTKGARLPYTINGNIIQIQISNSQSIQAARKNGPQQPMPPNNGGGNQGASSFVFFESANCAGRSFNFTKGMDCAPLAGSGVMSVSVNNQCSDFGGQQIDAGTICQQINAQ